jgi:hypothetical protein
MVVLGLGIAKHHGEQGEPAFDEIFEEAPPLGQIERVILVDDGGNEEDWTLPDLLGLRSILDKLEHSPGVTARFSPTLKERKSTCDGIGRRSAASFRKF